MKDTDSVHYSIINIFKREQNSINENTLKSILKSLNYTLEKFQKNFIQKDYVVYTEGIYHLNYQDRFLVSLRKSHDILCLDRLQNNLRTEIKLLTDELLDCYEDNIQSIFLIGSGARDTIQYDSDIDLLIICKNKFYYKTKNMYKKIQLIIYTLDEFKMKYDNKSELIIWAFHAGLLLHDTNFINKFYIEKNTQIAPHTVLIKRKLIKKIMDNFSSSKMYFDNIDTRILKQLIFHMARYILMLNNILPFSKQEIIQQVKKIDNNCSQTFSEILDDINHTEMTVEIYAKNYYILINSFKHYLNNK